MRAIARLEVYASDTTQAKASKLENNLRVMRAYPGYFSARRLKPQPYEPKTVMCEGVTLWLRPDMIASEGRRTRLIRFAFQKEGTNREEQVISVQLLYRYAREMGLNVGPADCLLYVVADGSIISLTGSVPRFDARLKAAMREVKRCWPDIAP